MKLSATSKTQYERCQRAFFYERVAKLEKDSDFKEPVYFFFGKAAHRCLEEFGYRGTNMRTSKIFEICQQEKITDEYDQARVAVAVRTYFACWPTTEVVAMEGEMETEFFKGRYDAFTKDERGYWILENKFHASISKELAVELTTDVQICSYAARAKEIQEALKLDGPIIGVKYRITTKNSQTVGGKRTQYAGALDFLEKAKNGNCIEFELLFEEMAIGIVETEMSMLCCEIEGKGLQEENFAQDLERCVWNEKRGEACGHYSRCHSGLLYSETKIDF